MKLIYKKENGQVAVQAVLLVLLFFLLASALVDANALLEARNWGYQSAQQAALAGVSKGRDWNGLKSPLCTGGPAPIQLDAATAQAAAGYFLQHEMNQRGIYFYGSDIRIMPDYAGGTISGFPPVPIRLGEGRGNWNATQPSVGVYLSFPVSTFLMSFVGRPIVQVRVFASASVHQPEGACKP